jgi:uncharacterized protein YegP (UPF0339 family)
MTRITIYKAKDDWRWRAIRGGRVVAESGEGYKERRKCVASLVNLINSFKSKHWSTNEQ